MKKNIIRNTLIATIAIVAGFNVYQSNVRIINLSDTSLTEVEAIAACEVSAISSNNKGVCVKDLNNTNEYCVVGSSWPTSPVCSETIDV